MIGPESRIQESSTGTASTSTLLLRHPPAGVVGLGRIGEDEDRLELADRRDHLAWVSRAASIVVPRHASSRWGQATRVRSWGDHSAGMRIGSGAVEPMRRV